MGWLSRTINSSIGRKTVMAVTGLLLSLFIIGHLLGNSNIFLGRAAFDSYAAHLHALGGLLHLVEIVLLLVFVLHVGFGLYLFLDNLRARPEGYAVTRSAGGRTPGSRTMPYTGLFILVFLADHLARFHFTPHTSVSDLVRENLTRPAIAVFYIAALTALTLHLSHGLWSLWQSLGFNHPKYETFLDRGGLALGILIGAILIMIPALALFWPGFLR